MPFEFPDPVVGRYMERIAQLAPADQELLDATVQKYFWGLPLHLLPLAWLHNLQVRFRCLVFIRRSVLGADQASRQRYYDFYRSLSEAGWTASAVGRAALGLFAVRLRDGVAMQLFEVALGQVLSPFAIGWVDKPVDETARTGETKY